MRVKLGVFIVAALCCLKALGIGAQELPSRIQQADFPFARNMAFGGGHVGLDGDFSSLFTNPAALVGVEQQKSISEFVIDVIDIDVVSNLITADDPLAELSSLLAYRIEASLDMAGPIAFGMVEDNHGWGVFNVTRFGMIWDRNNIYNVSLTLTEEFIIAGAYGWRLYDGTNSRFDLGLTAKLLVRMGYNSPPLYVQQLRYLLQDLVESPFETQLGAGVDTGFRWTLYDSLSFAAVLYDPFSPVWVTQYSKMEKIASQEMIAQGSVPVTPRASVGISWKMASPFWYRYFSGITFSLDYFGLLDNLSERPRDPLLNFSAGLEVRMLEVFTIRGGLRDLLPSVGVGLNYTFMNVDIAFYGKELGVEPYQYVTWAITLDFSFRKR
jgi:hypothetical protein